ncbi:MAG: glycerol-3-phosphate dehydrogenase/oxidase [Asgard group archaeon]|nr:glycerol-3-phosphate dehydrogenase/oxidase [Asgard group archaeon]
MSTSALETRKLLIDKLKSEEFDLLIIGAGITGAGIAWDASLRGLKVAIIDKNDFGFGTSSGSSKLVHAGLRYLSHGEFKLVSHASRERQWMFKSCPHQTVPIPFFIPIYEKGKNTLFRMSLAGALYDICARFKNTENHSFLSKDETLDLAPNLKSDTLKKALFYWDGIMDDARVTLETILSAREAGAITVNYIKANNFVFNDNTQQDGLVKEVQVEDILSGDRFDIKAKIFVNAVGPWTDEILSQFKDQNKLLRTTKGIHIVTKRLYKKNVVTVVTSDDNRSLYVIPFRKKYSLIGTTDTDYKEDFDHVVVTDEDIDYVIKSVNNDFPGSITKEDVISAYSGIRPLIISPKAKAETDTSRGYEIFETRANLLTITGGKYTIFRLMAEKIVNKALKILQYKIKEYPCTTEKAQFHGGEGITNLIDYLRKHVPPLIKKYDLPFDVVDHIVHTYGTSHTEVFDLINKQPELKETIADNRPHILAEINHAIQNEMCLTVSDFMFRRTQLQLIDNQGLDCVERIAEHMSKLLRWSSEEKKQQVEDYKKNLTWNKK